MPRVCAVCTHPTRTAIEAEIIAGRSLRVVAGAHDLRPAALHRHVRNHLPASIQAAAAAHLADMDAASVQPVATDAAPARALLFEDAPPIVSPALPAAAPAADEAPAAGTVPPILTSASSGPPAPLGLLGLAHSLRDRALSILAHAEAHGDQRTALAAIREARGVLESLARLEAPVGGSPTVQLTTSSDWTELRTVILDALADYPEARLAIATALAGEGALT